MIKTLNHIKLILQRDISERYGIDYCDLIWATYFMVLFTKKVQFDIMNLSKYILKPRRLSSLVLRRWWLCLSSCWCLFNTLQGYSFERRTAHDSNLFSWSILKKDPLWNSTLETRYLVNRRCSRLKTVRSSGRWHISSWFFDVVRI